MFTVYCLYTFLPLNESFEAINDALSPDCATVLLTIGNIFTIYKFLMVVFMNYFYF